MNLFAVQRSLVLEEYIWGDDAGAMDQVDKHTSQNW